MRGFLIFFKIHAFKHYSIFKKIVAYYFCNLSFVKKCFISPINVDQILDWFESRLVSFTIIKQSKLLKIKVLKAQYKSTCFINILDIFVKRGMFLCF